MNHKYEEVAISLPEKWHLWKMQLIFCAVTSFVSRADQNLFHVLRAELKSQIRFSVLFLLVSSLKHLMGFLLRELEIREKLTGLMVPCLCLISVSICIRHRSGELDLSPLQEHFYLVFFLGVYKLFVLWKKWFHLLNRVLQYWKFSRTFLKTKPLPVFLFCHVLENVCASMIP